MTERDETIIKPKSDEDAIIITKDDGENNSACSSTVVEVGVVSEAQIETIIRKTPSKEIIQTKSSFASSIESDTTTSRSIEDSGISASYSSSNDEIDVSTNHSIKSSSATSVSSKKVKIKKDKTTKKSEKKKKVAKDGKVKTKTVKKKKVVESEKESLIDDENNITTENNTKDDVKTPKKKKKKKIVVSGPVVVSAVPVIKSPTKSKSTDSSSDDNNINTELRRKASISPKRKVKKISTTELTTKAKVLPLDNTTDHSTSKNNDNSINNNNSPSRSSKNIDLENSPLIEVEDLTWDNLVEKVVKKVVSPKSSKKDKAKIIVEDTNDAQINNNNEKRPSIGTEIPSESDQRQVETDDSKQTIPANAESSEVKNLAEIPHATEAKLDIVEGAEEVVKSTNTPENDKPWDEDSEPSQAQHIKAKEYTSSLQDEDPGTNEKSSKADGADANKETEVVKNNEQVTSEEIKSESCINEKFPDSSTESRSLADVTSHAEESNDPDVCIRKPDDSQKKNEETDIRPDTTSSLITSNNNTMESLNPAGNDKSSIESKDNVGSTENGNSSESVNLCKSNTETINRSDTEDQEKSNDETEPISKAKDETKDHEKPISESVKTTEVKDEMKDQDKSSSGSETTTKLTEQSEKALTPSDGLQTAPAVEKKADIADTPNAVKTSEETVHVANQAEGINEGKNETDICLEAEAEMIQKPSVASVLDTSEVSDDVSLEASQDDDKKRTEYIDGKQTDVNGANEKGTKHNSETHHKRRTEANDEDSTMASTITGIYSGPVSYVEFHKVSDESTAKDKSMVSISENKASPRLPKSHVETPKEDCKQDDTRLNEIPKLLVADLWSAEASDVIEALKKLDEICKNEQNIAEVLKNGGHMSLILVLRKWLSSAAVQVAALTLLRTAAESLEFSDMIVQLGAMDLVLVTMKNHCNNEEVLTAGCGSLLNLTVSVESAKVFVFELHGIKTISAACSNFPKNITLQKYALWNIQYLSYWEDFREWIVKDGGLQALAEMVETLSHSSENTDNILKSARATMKRLL